MGEKTIRDIREEFKNTEAKDLPIFVMSYENDGREGVAKLVESAKKKYENHKKEVKRLEKMSVYEQKYREKGLICGIDEAGRGPLAGPVVAGAVILPADCIIPYLNDSKKLSEKRREELFDIIVHEALAVGVGIVSQERIDEINILQATYGAVQNLGIKPNILLNDAVTIPEIDVEQVPIVKGDAKSISIAAASIVAKVTRDHIMEEYDALWPEYGFASHKGYGTAAHMEAIRQYGPCTIHRRTFLPEK